MVAPSVAGIDVDIERAIGLGVHRTRSTSHIELGPVWNPRARGRRRRIVVPTIEDDDADQVETSLRALGEGRRAIEFLPSPPKSTASVRSVARAP
jgi:hypothetical protein